MGIAIRSIAALVSVTLFAGFAYGWYYYRKLDQGIRRGAYVRAVPNGSPAQVFNGQSMNILLVGLDSRADLSPAERKFLKVGNDQSTSTDTIVVAHVPADGKKATLISIPRDSYVDIPDGWAKNKINAAYPDAAGSAVSGPAQAKGMQLLANTVSNLTGLAIDHWVMVDFGGLYKIAQAINGIPVTLCESTDDTIAHNVATGQGRVGSGFKMTAGFHNLTPLQAFEFVRQRHNLAGEDKAREARQRYFLSAAFKKVANAGYLLNPSKMNKLLSAVNGAFTVDEGFNTLDFIEQVSQLSGGNLIGHVIPTTGTANVRIAQDTYNSSVLTVNPTKVQQQIKQWLNPAATYKPPTRTRSRTGATKGCIH